LLASWRLALAAAVSKVRLEDLSSEVLRVLAAVLEAELLESSNKGLDLKLDGKLAPEE
jgi:hypothetical protein